MKKSSKAKAAPERRIHPIDKLVWLSATELTANFYNPNKVFMPELNLLKRSLIVDGWTHPIVARPDKEIIDGFHRWYLTSNDVAVSELSDGQVPVVYLATENLAHQMMSTIRHNRARGSHLVLKMSVIVQDLIDKQGLSVAEIMAGLGMEKEEVERLYDKGTMVDHGSGDDFASGWVPDA